MMTTANKTLGQTDNKITALYCRLSDEDIKKDQYGNRLEDESNSIQNQKRILSDYAAAHGYTNTMFFVDDGISGTSFLRDDFQRMHQMVEAGEIGTVIVKDLSRFGREHIEGDRLAEIVYPTLGVTLISIQENVNTTTGEGMEMLPFHNLFNEWYASQTSKKIRAIWKSKDAHGERVSPTVPFGYMKSPEDKKQWIIDEPAAEIVRKIFDLCLAGRGPSQIARQLENEKIPIPSAYYARENRKCAQKVSKDNCHWDTGTIVGILENRQYTGCAVNFKSTTHSFKVHKKKYAAPEDYHIIPNMQEPIISEEKWLRVQELRSHRRRPTATGRLSLFSGLVYCADCKSKLSFCAAKSLRIDQEFFRCSNYKSGRGTCDIHYIRNVALEQIVLEAIQNFTTFVQCYEPVFRYMVAKNNSAMQKAEHKKLTQTVAKGESRIVELDKLIKGVFEKNILGTLSDERFQKLSAGYEKEQRELRAKVAESKEVLQAAEQKSVDLRLLIRTVQEITDMTKLTPQIVNSLIERIEVHSPEQKYAKKGKVKVDIYFTAVGMLDIPTDKEILAMIEEMQKNPVNCKTVA